MSRYRPQSFREYLEYILKLFVFYSKFTLIGTVFVLLAISVIRKPILGTVILSSILAVGVIIETLVYFRFRRHVYNTMSKMLLAHYLFAINAVELMWYFKFDISSKSSANSSASHAKLKT